MLDNFFFFGKKSLIDYFEKSFKLFTFWISNFRESDHKLSKMT